MSKRATRHSQFYPMQCTLFTPAPHPYIPYRVTKESTIYELISKDTSRSDKPRKAANYYLEKGTLEKQYRGIPLPQPTTSTSSTSIDSGPADVPPTLWLVGQFLSGPETGASYDPFVEWRPDCNWRCRCCNVTLKLVNKNQGDTVKGLREHARTAAHVQCLTVGTD